MSASTSATPLVPVNPIFITFCHPFNKKRILTLPKNNLLGTSPGIIDYGVHHATALSACQIIACNEPGILSTSTDRNDTNAQASPAQHEFLTSNRYYYHVTQSDVNYPICIKFALWTFPHNHFPPSWTRETPVVDAGFQNTGNWTCISERIKGRDTRCRVSGWVDNQTTAYIVPSSENDWMVGNGMGVFAGSTNELFLDRDSRNLFALRGDIHSSQFDSGNFVIVPMNGEMITHFIDASKESASRYHNKPFDTSYLSHEFLFARFAWAIIKKAHASFVVHPTAIRKTFILKTADAQTPLNKEEATGSDDGDGDDLDSDEPLAKAKKRKVHERPEFKSPAAYDDHVLKEDIRTAAKAARFFLEPDGTANPYAYEHMMWYPGLRIVERKKLEYMDAHPNIRACTGPCASPDTDSEAGFEAWVSLEVTKLGVNGKRA